MSLPGAGAGIDVTILNFKEGGQLPPYGRGMMPEDMEGYRDENPSSRTALYQTR